jgi:GT2 family glycosyltransferase
VLAAIDLSIVVPVYNEEENLPVLWPEIREVLDPTELSYEVVFVDDGSRDRSADIVRASTRQQTARGSSGSRPMPARRRPPTPASSRDGGAGWWSWTPISRTIPTISPAC